MIGFTLYGVILY